MIEQKKEVKNKKINKKKKMSFKSYIREFLLFVDKNILKTTGILAIIAVLLLAITIKPIITTTIAKECEGLCRDQVTFLSEISSKLQVILVTAVAGIVPYIYAPVVGFLGYIFSELTNFAYIIKGFGYVKGIAIGIVPLMLNVLTICIITALGIYICRKVTVGYRISNIKNMNFTNFKIRLYEILQKEKKVQALTKARDTKIEKLQAKKEKLNYIQILNTAIVVSIIQLVSVAIQEIML